MFRLFLFLVGMVSIAAAESVLHTLDREMLSTEYFCEGPESGNVSHDGKPDIVARLDFKTKHEIYPPKPQDRNRYADNLFSFVYDLNDDGWGDVLRVGFPGTSALVFENPRGKQGHWERHQIFNWVSNESPTLTDLVGVTRPQLICTKGGQFGYVTVDWENSFGEWTFHAVFGAIALQKFGHGLGVGDVNGDGLPDIVSAGMRGTQVLLQVARKVSAAEYDKAQPTRYIPPALPKGVLPKGGSGQALNLDFEKGTTVDLVKLTPATLAKLQAHPNEWHARHAHRVLQERLAKQSRSKDFGKADAILKTQLTKGKITGLRLRALWTLHAIHGLIEPELLALLKDREAMLRGWAIQLLCENKRPSAAARGEFDRMAREDKSPIVRMYLASALTRTPVTRRAKVLSGLLSHAEGADDQNLLHIYGYATEPVITANKTTAIQLLAKIKIPMVRQFITRRLASR